MPAEAAVTTPEADPIEADDGLLLVHTPPEGEEVYVAVFPLHKVLLPEIDVGVGYTVIL